MFCEVWLLLCGVDSVVLGGLGLVGRVNWFGWLVLWLLLCGVYVLFMDFFIVEKTPLEGVMLFLHEMTPWQH